MTPRPPALAAAVALLAVLGAGLALVGLLLLVVAAGGVSFLVLGGATAAAVGLLGATALALAGTTFLALVGLWRGRSWAWVTATAIAIAMVAGALVALGTSGTQVPVVAGFALTVAATAALLAPSTRRATGIG